MTTTKATTEFLKAQREAAATLKASPAVAALQDAEATLQAHRQTRVASMAQLPERHLDLARAQASGNVEAIGGAHDAIEELLARDRRYEAIEDSLVGLVAQRKKPVNEERSAVATEEAWKVGGEVQDGIEQVRTDLAIAIDRLDQMVALQSQFDVLRGRARSAASAAGIDMPQVGKTNQPFSAWAADLRAVLAMMEARKNV